MGVLTGAAVGSLWKLRNGCIVRVEDRSTSILYPERPYLLRIIDAPHEVIVSQRAIGVLQTTIHRNEDGDIHEDWVVPWAWAVVGPHQSKYPTNRKVGYGVT